MSVKLTVVCGATVTVDAGEQPTTVPLTLKLAVALLAEASVTFTVAAPT
jgi:hypothetical protein